MLFNSYRFMLFFPIVTIVYFSLHNKYKCFWLLVSSFYFYASWNIKYTLLLLCVVVLSYTCGFLCEKYKKKKYLVFDIFLSLGLLLYFKYFNFLVDSINNIKLCGKIEFVNVVLPVGISFYVFQSIGYVVDVYKGKIKAENNIIDYSLFLSFYPLLLAGPIERAKNILPQLKKIKQDSKFNISNLKDGLLQMLYGYFMKIVIADRLSIIANNAFLNYISLNRISLLFGAICFAIQIYCDFAGYSSIAIGCAKIYGVDLINNFKSPYFSYSISDFWRRWHISLSSWFKDYVYIPLGGSKCSKTRNYLNILITMALSGLWHGLSWNYVFWGCSLGIIQIIEKKLGLVKKPKNNLIKFIRIVLNCFIVIFTWIFFKADSIEHGFDYLKNMLFVNENGIFVGGLSALEISKWDMLILVVSICMLIFFDFIEYKLNYKFNDFVNSLCLPLSWLCIIGMFCFVLIFGIYGPGSIETAFLYFKF